MFLRVSSVAALTALVACNADPVPSAKPRVETLTFNVAIDASGTCTLDGRVTPCNGVGGSLREVAPNSQPAVLICPDRESTYEATAAVLRSLEAAGVLDVSFRCQSKARPVT